MPCTITSDQGVIKLEGVRGFSPAEYADSVHGAEARILETLGESIGYDDLIGYSGFAFRVNVHEAMCPSSGHPCCGYPCIDNAIRARPWRARPYLAFPWDPPKADRRAFEAEAYAAVKDSIDRGVPVHYGSEEDGLIIGYADEGRRWWCVHPYYKWAAEPFWHDEVSGFAGGKWPWAITVWLAPKLEPDRADPRALTVAALKQAVDMWRTEKRGDYYCGEAAYGHWLGWLGRVDAGEVADPKAGMQGNGWCFDVLTHSRRIAARWLEQQADLFDEPARGALRNAAGCYARLTEGCMAGLKCTWSLALSPDAYENWTPDLRADQINRLAFAREQDEAAIAEIEAALETIE